MLVTTDQIINSIFIAWCVLAGFITGLSISTMILNDKQLEQQNAIIFKKPEAVSIKPVVEPETTPKIALVSAYSCGGLTTQAQIDMNCPSLKYSENGLTANGTEPVPYKTMACDSANMGKTFNLEGYGEIECTDLGSAIVGSGRFDLYLPTVEDARQFGVQYREYREVF